MTILASGQFTVIDLNDPIISDTAPPLAVKDMLWLDTSVTPNQLKRYTGNEWVTVNDYHDDLNDAKTEITETFNSSITQTKDSITQLVESEYSSKDETEELTQQFNTRIEQTSKNVEIQFNTTQELINKLDGKVDTNKQEIQKFIRFIDGQIELGQSNSSFSLTISNNRISFKDSGTEVAYISDSTLYITDAHVTNSLSIGKFSWVPTSSGMGLKYVG